MILHAGFEPDGARGAMVDAGVRARLADSLARLLDAVAGNLPIDIDAIRTLTVAVRVHPVRPGVMVLYADAVPALLEGRMDAAQGILADLARPAWQDRALPRVVTLHDDQLGQGMANRYLHHLQDDEVYAASLDPCSIAEMDDAQDRIAEARAFLAAIHPPLQAEMDGLVNEVVLVKSRAAPGAPVLHGASSFFVWGALALNPAEHPSKVKLVEGLVHESSHGLLHGLTLGGTLVENDPAERYRSPLRDDPRPVEGLVHAAYVLARMHLAMAAVEQARHVPLIEREQAGRNRAMAARSFQEALSVIAPHARFNSVGTAIFGGAERYMAEVAGIRRLATDRPG